MRILSTLTALVVAVFGPTCAAYADTAVPYFRDAKQTLPKPEMTLPRLRFLTTTDFYPFNFIDDDGRLAGFHVDLARAICLELDIEERCQIQALPFEELVPALNGGQGEALIAGLTINERTRDNFAFSRAYMAFPARFVAERDSELREPVHRSLDDARVGVMADSAHEQMLRDFFTPGQVVTYSRQSWMTGDLRAGKLDAVFGDGLRLSLWLVDETESAACCAFAGGPYLAPEYFGRGLAIAVSQEQAELATAFDYALQRIEENGTFGELYLRYFPIGFF